MIEQICSRGNHFHDFQYDIMWDLIQSGLKEPIYHPAMEILTRLKQFERTRLSRLGFFNIANDIDYLEEFINSGR